MLDLDPPARLVTMLLEAVTDPQLDAPTPGGGGTVGALLDHLMALTVAFRCAAAKELPPGGESPPGEESLVHLDPAWRQVLPGRLAALAEAWRDPAAWAGETTAGGVTAPAEVLGTVAVAELVLHGWDLARATDQPFSPDAPSVAAALEFTSMISAPGMEESRGSAFGPVVAVPAGASTLERALGLSGRDLGWRRAVAS